MSGDDLVIGLVDLLLSLETQGYSRCLPTCLGVVWRMLRTFSDSSKASLLLLLHPWSRSRTWPCILLLRPRMGRNRSDKWRCWPASWCPLSPHPPVSPARLPQPGPVSLSRPKNLVWSGPWSAGSQQISHHGTATENILTQILENISALFLSMFS